MREVVSKRQAHSVGHQFLVHVVLAKEHAVKAKWHRLLPHLVPLYSPNMTTTGKLVKCAETCKPELFGDAPHLMRMSDRS